MGGIERTADGNRLGRIAHAVLRLKIFLGQPFVHEGREADHALLLLRAQILEVPAHRRARLPPLGSFLRRRVRRKREEARKEHQNGKRCEAEQSRGMHRQSSTLSPILAARMAGLRVSSLVADQKSMTPGVARSEAGLEGLEAPFKLPLL